jgi:hypothetical protein
MSNLPRLALTAALALTTACGRDHLHTVSCPETVTETVNETTTSTSTSTSTHSAFDIDQVSVLEATDEVYGGADAVILDHDATQVPANATWRVSSVDVLVMVPSSVFTGYPTSVGQSSVGLAVQVWDTNTPKDAQKPPYTLRQVLNPAALSWDSVTLSGRTYRRAWWRFTFADAQQPLIPATGMTAAQFLVGIKWTAAPSRRWATRTSTARVTATGRTCRARERGRSTRPRVQPVPATGRCCG